jgi:hypothetical protein
MWVVKNLPVEKLAKSTGMSAPHVADVVRQRDEILEKIARLTGHDL